MNRPNHRLASRIAAALAISLGAAPLSHSRPEPRPPAHRGTVRVDELGRVHQPGGARVQVSRIRRAKPLSAQVKRGLAWLVAHQLPSGGWGQGDESPEMRQGGVGPRDSANVADTSMAVLALLRGGSTPAQGPHARAVDAGLAYILGEIERSGSDSLYVTSVRGTRVQAKIGTYVDTFAALMALTEARGKMPDARRNQRLDRALARVLAKIERHQGRDGAFANQGWAPVLSQSLAAKGLNRAAQQGAPVKEETLDRAEAYARGQFDARSGQFTASGAAGVDLYAGAASSAAIRESANTRKARVEQIRTASEPGQRDRAGRVMQAARDTERSADSAEQALLARLDDPGFVAGFGSNGGEEFLSYMLVSESLVVKGGPAWERWDQRIAGLIERVQNGDGSWTGHHCITGRTFCTAAALLVLMADRAPVPVAGKLMHG